ncbi:E3 ubiquitin-protein ligase TRIM39-like [Pseudonaja textilis]|uniref:E3 ubiquitin-protein ligase TRIM39-like n=1 Tax=Pseudonaja textilis TaxID=8673 RepID=UPI000EA880B4|nr:E3 ubiquitin-protein ligase TRIM39-like [Pseudonaja textilis]XP_026579463.1 E3 ubiquitin-protein ligase TRIM39-like [Pseudonaja textilis]XP_026579464.1 E3 ubiquitin-protein ligase TRIM39-like [Pseudonaja textilis]
MSHTSRCKLVEYLEELNDEEFEKFKLHLEDYPVEKGYKPIRRCKTEKAAHVEIARYMIEAYDDAKALKMTVRILNGINKKDLAARIQKEMPDYFLQFPESDNETISEPQNKVEVMLDPKTAFPTLILSEDRKSVYMGDRAQDFPDNLERFNFLPCVLGTEGIDSGTSQWVVEVGNAKQWAVGAVRESIERKGYLNIGATEGFWVLQLMDGEYEVTTTPKTILPLWKTVQRILITLEFSLGKLSFFDVDSMEIIFTFNYPFSEKMFPFFLTWDKKNPLKISTDYSAK